MGPPRPREYVSSDSRPPRPCELQATTGGRAGDSESARERHTSMEHAVSAHGGPAHAGEAAQRSLQQQQDETQAASAPAPPAPHAPQEPPAPVPSGGQAAAADQEAESPQDAAAPCATCFSANKLEDILLTLALGHALRRSSSPLATVPGEVMQHHVARHVRALFLSELGERGLLTPARKPAASQPPAVSRVRKSTMARPAPACARLNFDEAAGGAPRPRFTVSDFRAHPGKGLFQGLEAFQPSDAGEPSTRGHGSAASPELDSANLLLQAIFKPIVHDETALASSSLRAPPHLRVSSEEPDDLDCN